MNAKGAENGNQYNCSSNEANYAGHIWDYDAVDGNRGATACIVVPSFVPYFNDTSDWQALAWWIHDNVPGYSSMFFFPKNAAFNISWCTSPLKRIDSYIVPKGCLIKAGQKNKQGDHNSTYQRLIKSIGSKQ